MGKYTEMMDEGGRREERRGGDGNALLVGQSKGPGTARGDYGTYLGPHVDPEPSGFYFGLGEQLTLSGFVATSVTRDSMGNGQSTPKGKRSQRVVGQPILQYEDNASSISSGHYVSAKNLASLEPSPKPDKHGRKAQTSKKGREKNKSHEVQNSSHSDMYERKSLESEEAEGFRREMSSDDDLEDAYATVSSPSVPELIVDVLHADVNDDSTDHYYLPSPAMPRSNIKPDLSKDDHGEDVSNKSLTTDFSSRANTAEMTSSPTNITVTSSSTNITVDTSSTTVKTDVSINKTDKPYSNSNSDNSSKELTMDVSSKQTQPLFNNSSNVLTSGATSETDQSSIPTHEVYNGFEYATVDKLNRSYQENEYNFARDSGLHYPMIFRRSKKDPGSKQYNELVKELSAVLEKRARNNRPLSMHEDSLGEELELQIAKAKASRRNSKSLENLSGTVFSNKSLLNKLENHLMAKNRTNIAISEDGTKNSTTDSAKESETVTVDRIHGDDKSGINPVEKSSHSRTDLNFENGGGAPDIYAVPNKVVVVTHPNLAAASATNGTSAQANATNGHSVTVSSRSWDQGLTNSSFQSDDLTYATSNYNRRNSGRRTLASDNNYNAAPTTFSSDVSDSQGSRQAGHEVSASSVNHSAHQHNFYQPPQPSSDHTSSSSSRPNLNTPTSPLVHNVTVSSSTRLVDTSDKDNNLCQSDRPVSTTSGIIFPTSSQHERSLNGSRRLDVSSDNIRTIRVPVTGLRRDGKIMSSVPDLSKGFSTHRGDPTPDGGFIITKLNQEASPKFGGGVVNKNQGHEGVPVPGGGFIIRKLGPGHHVTSSLTRTNRELYRSIDGLGDNTRYFNDGHTFSTTLEKSQSTTDVRRDENLLDRSRAHILFNHNQSYDVSFSNETLDDDFSRSSYPSSDVSSSGLSSPRSQMTRVHADHPRDSGSGSTSSADMYFISSDGVSKSVHVLRSASGVASPRSPPVTMTTISEYPARRIFARDSSSESSSSVFSAPWSPHGTDADRRLMTVKAVSLRSLTDPQLDTLRLNDHHYIKHQDYHASTIGGYRKTAPRSDTSFTSDQSSSSSYVGSLGGKIASGSDPVNTSQRFIVVPPHPRGVRVPDLIVDHQKGKSQTKLGSPFHQDISEGTLPTAHGEGLHRGEEDKPATFVIDARNMKGDPSVQVDGPNAIAKCSIDPQPDGQYKVTYIPVEVGLFDVYVRWNGKEIPGSPFHPKVVDARKVKVIGGWHHYMDGQERIHLVVGEEKQIPFDTSEAGPGHLRAEVKSPSSFLPVEVDDEHKGKSVVKFVPREEGLHHIHLYWSDHPLVNSPYMGYAVSGVADPSKVWLTGRGLKEAIVREEAEFTIDGSQAGPGEPDIELTGVRAEIQVFKTPLGGGKYRCTYIPVIPGAYLLNISWNGRQLRGAPYKVNVIGASYPNRVVVNGEGLKGGLLGNSLDFRIDTRKAGPGELTAYCMGPTKVAYCELSDHHDGTYRLVVQPQEAGRHVLQIKYGGEHVQGSPYHFKVSAQPDASKVRVSGPGVEHGILANFQSQFIVETRGAGAGQLTVRIRGPKGAFQVEMYRESQKDRTILCRYYPSVTGLYIIHVRWSGVDVPGSPFQVQILDTQQELEQVLHEQSFNSSGHHNHLASHPNSSFHNSSISSSTHMRGYPQQSSQHHNMSRSSGYYHQWSGEM